MTSFSLNLNTFEPADRSLALRFLGRVGAVTTISLIVKVKDSS